MRDVVEVDAPDPSPRFALTRAVVTLIAVGLLGGLVLAARGTAINGLGLREQLHAILLQPLGVTREAAVAISLLTFAHLLVSSLVGVFFWMQLPAAARGHLPTAESEIQLDS